MSSTHDYHATIVWQRRDGEKYTDHRYSRGHEWRFDGLTVPASSSPHVVPLPHSNANAVDPEEAFVASLSSCHMLFFLYHAAKKGFVVDRYEDAAVGTMGKNASGRTGMIKVVLRPRVTWSGDQRPSAADVDALHHQSHEDCYIANSVTTEVAIEAAP